MWYTKKMEIVVDSCVRGYHMYQEIWTPVSGNYLNCKRERDNTEDRHAVAVCKPEDVVVAWPQASHNFMPVLSIY